MAKIKKRKIGGNTKKLVSSDASYNNPNSIVEQQKSSLKNYKYKQQALVRKSISGPSAGAIATENRPAAFNTRARNPKAKPVTAPNKARSGGIKKRTKKK